MMIYDTIIVGAGQAGAYAAIHLRQNGDRGSILVIGEEPHAPYERPPLSKEYLAGKRHRDRLLLRPIEFWIRRDVALLPGTRVVRVDPAARVVATSNVEQIGYRRLIWAAGGAPRPLNVPGAGLAGVHSIRTLDQVDRLQAELTAATNVVIIGGGYVGLEAAAVLATSGRKVTLLSRDRLLARVTHPVISSFYEAEHRRNGVDVRTGTEVTELIGAGARVTAVRTCRGEQIASDVVIVGIGISPNQVALAAAGAACTDGVIVDPFCRTSLPHIYAIGDCARHSNIFAGGRQIRLESVQNAIDQARTAADAIMGDPSPYQALPWFWSDQYDLKLQTAGLNLGYDEAIIRGVPASGSFSVVYLGQGRVIAVDAVNRAKDFMGGKLLVAAGAAPDRRLLADTATELKSIAAAGSGAGGSTANNDWCDQLVTREHV